MLEILVIVESKISLLLHYLMLLFLIYPLFIKKNNAGIWLSFSTYQKGQFSKFDKMFNMKSKKLITLNWIS